MGRGRFLRSLKQRWWLLLLLVVPTTAGVLIYTLMSKPRYEAFMTLADRRDPDLNLPVLYQDQLMTRGVNDTELRVLNLTSTIGSFTVLKQAFDQLASEGYIKDTSQEALRDFIGDISITPQRGTEFVQVSYVDDDPDVARKVIEVIRDKFMTRYASLVSAPSDARVEFIRQQLAREKAAYDAKLQEQKEFQEQYPDAIGYETTVGSLAAQIQQVKQRIADAERAMNVAQATLDVTRAQANRSPMTDPLQTINRNPNPTYESLKQRIQTAESLYEARSQRYGPNHPSMIELRKQIEEDKAALAQTDPFVVGTGYQEKPPFEQERLNAELQAERQLEYARAEKASAEAELRALEQRKAALPVVQKRLSELTAELLAHQSAVANMQAKLQEAQVREAQNNQPTIYMLDDPSVRELPRNTILKTLVTLFLSLVVAISLIAGLGQIDQGTYTPLEAENSLGFPVLGVLPKSAQKRLPIGEERPSALAASYQMLSSQIMAVRDKLVGPCILVAAAEPDSGRTTVAANLAISLARDGARVLLVDADLRDPKLHEHFDLENRAGLAEILSGAATMESVVQPSGVDGCLIITAGQPPVNPVRLFRSQAMSDFVEMVSQGADYVVFDCAAGSTFGDAAVLAELVQNVVLIHEAGRPPTIAEFEFHKALERLGVNILGLVLNKARPDDCPTYQHYRRNYERTIHRYHPTTGRAALASGDKPVRGEKREPEKPEQFGAAPEDDEE
jgi:capsular exopolysaccharide synthesis family protein